LKNVKPFTLSRLLRPRDRSRSENMRGGEAGSLSWAVTIQLETTLALTPAQGVSTFRRDFVRSPGEREKLSSASPNLTIR
jgi:hypothetical protein